ncbi:MAG: oligosaccharide flippase family protein, partial [Saprospiraceae bacterium]
MKREFLINILLLVGINLLIKPIYIFGIDRVVQNAVGKEEFGLYFAVFNFTFLLQIINDFGIHTFNSKHISQNRDLLKSYFPNVLMLKTLLAVFYMLVIFLTAIPSGYTAPEYLSFLWWLTLIHILNSLMLYLRSNIAALGWYRTDSWLSSLNKFLMILVCAPLLWIPSFYDRFQIEWFIYAQISTLIVTAIVALWLTRNEVSWSGWKLDFSFLKRIIKESYPYALAIFLMTVYTRVDAVMIERMLPDGAAEAGIYAGAYRLLDASNMIGFLFAGLLLPMFARMLKAKEDYQDLLRFSLQIILAGAISLSLPVYFFREE